MVVIFTMIYLALCGLAYWGWNDWVVSGDAPVLKSQVVIKNRVVRVLLRLSMITLGPVWFIIAGGTAIVMILNSWSKWFFGSLFK